MEERTIDIALTPVQSSQIHAIGYDADTSTLRVQFKGAKGPGSIYDYDAVPADTAEAFRKADSIGRYFGAQIKGKFEFRRLPPAAPAALDLNSDKPLTGGNGCAGETCEACQ